MGGDLFSSGGPSEFDVPAAGVQRVDAGVSLGIASNSWTGRTLLRAVPLPLPPSINAYYGTRVVESKDRKDRFGRPLKIAITYTTDEGKVYQKDIRDRMLEMKAWQHSEYPLELCILVCPRDEREQDISNRIKVLEDALQNGNVFKNDSQVETLEVRRGPKVKGGAVYVTVREILPDRTGNLRWIRER